MNSWRSPLCVGVKAEMMTIAALAAAVMAEADFEYWPLTVLVVMLEDLVVSQPLPPCWAVLAEVGDYC